MATLTGTGLHELVWETTDEWVGDVFVASPADAEGRGIALAVRRGGEAADLTGATVYLLWRHRESLARGTTAFEAVDAAGGTFQVYYPAAMAAHEGTVDAQVMVSEDGTCLSTRTFQIRVEPVLVGDTDAEDGFTLFVEAIRAYEDAEEVSTDAAMAANAAAAAANQAAADLRAAAAAGEFDGADGADGQDGADGVSPTAYVEQTSTGALLTVTDAGGTTTATLSHGPKGDKGDQGVRGVQGTPGTDGIPCTHSWDGSVLTVTSASGTSSADLAGPQGPTGQTGAQGPAGPAGADGTSPSATVAKSGTTATITITDASGTTTATVSDGANGEDYVLTGQDKSDIAALVAAMFTNGDSQSY